MGSIRVIEREPWDYPEAVPLEFRLTYEGPLHSTQRDPENDQFLPVSKRDHKRAIRRVFHAQLRHLWEVTPFLRRGVTGGPYEAEIGSWKDGETPAFTPDALAARHSHYGFGFVPLATEDLGLQCGLDILFLRPDPPGKLVQSGDIDNRLKTLFDCLRVPVAGEGWHALAPAEDELPFFCLMEDDRLISKIAVETDMLLDPKAGQNDVRLVIKVTLRPSEMHAGVLPFA